jgi:hypothetical protein
MKRLPLSKRLPNLFFTFLFLLLFFTIIVFSYSVHQGETMTEQLPKIITLQIMASVMGILVHLLGYCLGKLNVFWNYWNRSVVAQLVIMILSFVSLVISFQPRFALICHCGTVIGPNFWLFMVGILFFLFSVLHSTLLIKRE